MNHSNSALKVQTERYKKLLRIGEGSSSEVFKACDLKTNKLVALKILKPDLRSNQEVKNRFLKEIRCGQQLKHKNILPILDFCTGVPFMATEYLPHGTLSLYLQNLRSFGRTLPIQHCLDITIELAETLTYIHSTGLIHCDIKPQNILLKSAGLKQAQEFPFSNILTDFGISTQEYTSTKGRSTPSYAAPEQLEGELIDVRTDVYSLNALLYELLTGHTAIKAETNEEALALLKSKGVNSPRRVNNEVPVKLSELVLTGLNCKSLKRFPCMQTFADLLKEFRHDFCKRQQLFALKK